MSDLTRDQLEALLDDTLARSAQAVSELVEKMERQQTDTRLVMAAILLACGGKVTVTQRHMIMAYDMQLIVEDNPAEHGHTFKVR